MKLNFKTIWFYVTFAVLLFVIYGSWELSITEFKLKNICPKVVGIPACYLVLISFALVFLSHVLRSAFKNSIWYFGFIAFPFLLALGGTLTELSGTVVCPRTPGGTPMCYISLGMCSLLIILKIAEIRARQL